MKLTRKLISAVSALAMMLTMFSGLTAFAEDPAMLTLEKNKASTDTQIIIDAKSTVTAGLMSLTVQLDLSGFGTNISSCTVTRGSVLTGSGGGNFITNTKRAVFNDANGMGSAISTDDILGTITINLKEALTEDVKISSPIFIMQLDTDGDMVVDAKYNLTGTTGYTKAAPISYVVSPASTGSEVTVITTEEDGKTGVYLDKVALSGLSHDTKFVIKYTGSDTELNENGAKTEKTIERNLGQILGGEFLVGTGVEGNLHFGIKLPTEKISEAANFSVTTE